METLEQVSTHRSPIPPLTARIRLPEFFAIGPPRTATTWLHRALSGRVNLPRVVKEPRFFDLRYSKGLDWYRAHFAPLVDGLPLGEIAPTYFYSTDARGRIANLVPNARIICTLRDPVERLYSLYKVRAATGAVRRPFAEAIDRDPELVESNRYLFHVKSWIDLFGRDRVLVLIHERLAEDPKVFLDRVCRFLGIAPFPLDPKLLERDNSSETYPAPGFGRLTDLAVKIGASLNTNSRNRTLALVRRLGINRWFFKGVPFKPPPLDPTVAEKIRARMRSEIEGLEALLNTDLSAWKCASPSSRKFQP